MVPFELLYLAADPLLSLFEVQAMLGSPYPGSSAVPNPARPWATINVNVNLRYVIDLTYDAEIARLSTTIQELTGDWQGYSLRPLPPRTAHVSAPTQQLGETLASIANVEGFLTFSARDATRKNLIVFPQNLTAPSQVSFVDPITGIVHTLP